MIKIVLHFTKTTCKIREISNLFYKRFKCTAWRDIKSNTPITINQRSYDHKNAWILCALESIGWSVTVEIHCGIQLGHEQWTVRREVKLSTTRDKTSRCRKKAKKRVTENKRNVNKSRWALNHSPFRALAFFFLCDLNAKKYVKVPTAFMTSVLRANNFLMMILFGWLWLFVGKNFLFLWKRLLKSEFRR